MFSSINVTTYNEGVDKFLVIIYKKERYEPLIETIELPIYYKKVSIHNTRKG